MIIIPIKWLFHWGYTPFSDIPMWNLNPQICYVFGAVVGAMHFFRQTQITTKIPSSTPYDSMTALALAAAPTPRSRVMQPLTVTNAVEPWRGGDLPWRFPRGLHHELNGISWWFHGDLMGFHGELVGFNGIYIVGFNGIWWGYGCNDYNL